MVKEFSWQWLVKMNSGFNGQDMQIRLKFLKYLKDVSPVAKSQGLWPVLIRLIFVSGDWNVKSKMSFQNDV